MFCNLLSQVQSFMAGFDMQAKQIPTRDAMMEEMPFFSWSINPSCQGFSFRKALSLHRSEECERHTVGAAKHLLVTYMHKVSFWVSRMLLWINEPLLDQAKGLSCPTASSKQWSTWRLWEALNQEMEAIALFQTLISRDMEPLARGHW